MEFHPYNVDAANRQIAKLKTIKTSRDSGKVNNALQRLRDDANKGVNLMPATIEAVKAYVSVGEIVQVLKEVYGEYEEPIFFNRR